MASTSNQLAISTPFGRLKDRASSPRYHFKSDQRGDEQFVIIQRSLAGYGIFQWQNRSWEVPPGHAFICIVPEESAYHFPPAGFEPWHFEWLNLYGSLALSLARSFREEYAAVLPLPSRSTAHTSFRALIGSAENRLSPDPCDASVAAFAFLMEWKRLLDHPHPHRADPVRTVAQICQARFREQLGVKELAAQVGLSREHLTRLFSERQKISPAQYLRKLRTRAARKMLRDTNLTLGETSLRCGFPSVKALRRSLDKK